jgi:hypothetical protein
MTLFFATEQHAAPDVPFDRLGSPAILASAIDAFLGASRSGAD